MIWVGTDDGNLQLTRDGGKSWTNVVANVPGLPAASWVSWVEASRFAPATAYAAFDRHTFGDMTPWVFRTTDFGKSWTRIVGPEQGVRGYAHVIKEDTVEPSLLFLGTEMGLWISLDGGGDWAEFKGGDFPSVPVRDLQVHPREGDLVLATHGRGIWIVDDLTPLRALAGAGGSTSHRPWRRPGPTAPSSSPAGRCRSGCPPSAAGSRATPASSAEIRRAAPSSPTTSRPGTCSDRSSSRSSTPPASWSTRLAASQRRGLNRVVWSLQVKPPRVPRAATLAYNASQGPRVPPGTYTVRLTKGDRVDREQTGGRHRPPGAVHRRGSPGAVRGGDAGARAVRGDERAGGPHRRGPRGGREEPGGAARGRPAAAGGWRAGSTGSTPSSARSSPPRRAAPSPARSASASTWTPSTAC